MAASGRASFLLVVVLAALAASAQAQSAALPSGPLTQEETRQEIGVKLARVKGFLDQRHLAGILLTRVNNFAWMTAGAGDNEIVITSEAGAASLLVMADGRKYLVGEEGEVLRHDREDLAGLGFEPQPVRWDEEQGAADGKLALIHRLAHGQAVGTDLPFGDLAMVGELFAPLRYQLTDTEIKKYRWVGRQATEAVIAVCRKLRPGVTEKQMEAMASDELMRRGLRPTVLLMGVDRRVSDFYHHQPTDLALDKYAIVNVCARRWGLVASVARFVHFGPLDAEMEKRLAASMKISAQYQAHSRPGVTAGQMIAMAQGWFAEAGFPGDWQMHHQGGAIGYAEREWIAVPESQLPILDRQAFAWNPIVRGALSFDTILVFKDHAENLTQTADWPTRAIEVDGKNYKMPEILIVEQPGGGHKPIPGSAPGAPGGTPAH